MLELNEKVLSYLKDSEQENYALLEELSQIPAPSGQEDLRVDFVKNWFYNNGAKEVFESGLNIVMIGLNSTNQTMLDTATRTNLRSTRSAI